MTGTVDVYPPWKKVLQSKTHAAAVAAPEKAVYLSVATVDADNQPFAELLEYRGFAGEDNNGETGWASDLLTSVSDKRVLKLADDSQFAATFVVEGTQFRIRGKLHLLTQGASVDDIKDHIVHKKLSKMLTESNEDDVSEKVSVATKSFLKRIRSQFHRRHKKEAEQEEEQAPPEFDWEAERLRQWHDLQDSTRATFCWDTAPGELKEDSSSEELPRIQSLEIGETDAEGWFKNADQDKQAMLERGYENFVVVLLELSEIDTYTLSENKRTLFRKDGTSWEKVPIHA